MLGSASSDVALLGSIPTCELTLKQINMKNQRFINTTRDQVVLVTDVGYNLSKKGDTEVADGMKIEYKVTQATSENPIKEFVCTEERFNRLYVRL